MADIHEVLQNHSDQIALFFLNSETVVFIGIDSQGMITVCNNWFKKNVLGGTEACGCHIHKFLLDESYAFFPPQTEQDAYECSLNFKGRTGAHLHIIGHAFKSCDNGYVFLGGKCLSTNDKTLEKMTLLTNEITNISRDLRRKNRELSEAQSHIKVLSGVIPICMHCKNIRNDKGYWNKLEEFITNNSEAQFSHGICDACLELHYPEAPDETG